MLNTNRLYELTKKKNKKETLSDKEEMELLDLTNKLYIAIENCNSTIVKETILKRYTEAKTWAEIAEEMFDITTDAPRKRAYRELKKMKH